MATIRCATTTITLLLLLLLISKSESQQEYVNNKQLDCDNEYNSTKGNLCNSVSSCTSYLTFKSSSTYNNPITISYLLNSTPAVIAAADTLITIPVNCTCSGPYYQHNTSYSIKVQGETFFTIANNTYQSLTTCQALKEQNPSYNERNLSKGDNFHVPLRCACPTQKQRQAGFKYLLTYLISQGESVSSIADIFGVDEQSVLDANQLSATSVIFYFTPISVPLKTEPPKKIQREASPPEDSPPPPPPTPTGNGDSNSSKKWVIVGVTVGVEPNAREFLNEEKHKKHRDIIEQYRSKAEYYICSCLNKNNDGDNVERTPAGLIYVRQWNNMQYVSTATFLLSMYSDFLQNTNQKLNCHKGTVDHEEILNFAKSQVDYILGSNPMNMSYLVGYGPNYPKRVHHRGASIVSYKKNKGFIGCTQGYDNWYGSHEPNPNVLVGALVGGPDGKDNFEDQRSNFMQTEACTYNTAPLVGVFAKFLHIENHKMEHDCNSLLIASFK